MISYGIAPVTPPDSGPGGGPDWDMVADIADDDGDDFDMLIGAYLSRRRRRRVERDTRVGVARGILYTRAKNRISLKGLRRG